MHYPRQTQPLDYDYEHLPTLDDQHHQQAILLEAGHVVNDLLHDEIKRQAVTVPQTKHDPLNLNIDQYLNEVNPLLVKFLTSAIHTVRERRHSLPDCETTSHIKRVRQFFILCQLLYCTNPTQPTPTHNLLADVVEVCGGSRQLLKILNRIGCVSSPDTHDRFVTHHAELQRQTSVWDEMSEQTFTIASTDNIDKLQSYSAVYCGDQQRSYHGTTIQLVQPNPKLLIPSPICKTSPPTSSPTSIPLVVSSNPTPIPLVSTTITEALHPQPHMSVASTSADTTINTFDRAIQPVATKSPPPKSIFQQRRRNRLPSPASSPHKMGKVGPK